MTSKRITEAEAEKRSSRGRDVGKVIDEANRKTSSKSRGNFKGVGDNYNKIDWSKE